MFFYLSKNKLQFYLFAFLVGITIHSLFPLKQISMLVWSCLLLVMVAVYSINKRSKILFFALLSLCLGLLRFDLSIASGEFTANNRHQALIASLRPGKYGPQAIAKIEGRPTWHPPQKIRLNLKDPIPIGSKIEFDCMIKTIQKQEDQSKYDFYRLHYYGAYSCNPQNINILAQPNPLDFRYDFYNWRASLTGRIQSEIPGDDGILIAGVLYGERGMSAQNEELFRRAGLTHIIAVSGSNMTLIVSIVFAVFLGLGLWRRQAFQITCVSIIAFTFFVGLSASVLRAAIMGILVLTARHLGRITKPGHLLMAAATILCIYNPWMFVYDAGFALSFLASIGLIYGSSVLIEKLSYIPEFFGLREAAATTLAASIMTIPYIALVFERLSLAGLFTNLAAVPLVPWLMLLGAASALTSGTLIAPLFALPAAGVSKIIFSVSGLVNIFPWLDIHINGMNLVFCLGTYAFIIIFWYRLRQKN